jgi:hypothetical protein
MKKLLACLLLGALLCGCAAAGPAPQGGVLADPTNASTMDTPNVIVPTATVPKNPGLTMDPSDPDDMVPELTEQRIRQDYCNTYPNITVDQVRLRFMGAFGSVYVMFVDVKGMMYAEVINTENVGGIQFVYSCSQHMQVWHEGEFYSLRLAYDAGLLTTENLRQLAIDYYGAYPHLWQYVAVPE